MVTDSDFRKFREIHGEYRSYVALHNKTLLVCKIVVQIPQSMCGAVTRNTIEHFMTSCLVSLPLRHTYHDVLLDNPGVVTFALLDALGHEQLLWTVYDQFLPLNNTEFVLLVTVLNVLC